MKRVQVVGTFHAEAGLVTVDGLVAILQRLRPEVIFLEAPVGTLESYLTRPDRTLESQAVNRYRQAHPVALVPVDLPTPPPEFFHSGAELYGRIESRSADYCRLHDRDLQYTREGGFPYLNSDTFAEVQSARHKVILTTLDDLGEQRLADIYRLWCDTIRLREVEMTRNIESYFQNSDVEVGVLLVGAAHRRSFGDKPQEGADADPSTLRWELWAALYVPTSAENEPPQ